MRESPVGGTRDRYLESAFETSDGTEDAGTEEIFACEKDVQ